MLTREEQKAEDALRKEAMARLDPRVVAALRSLQRFAHIRATDPEAVVRDINAVMGTSDRYIKIEVRVVRPEVPDEEKIVAIERQAYEAVLDIRKIHLTIDVGAEPCTRMVPERIRCVFYPIDLVDGPTDPRPIPTGRVVAEEADLKREMTQNSKHLAFNLTPEEESDLVARYHDMSLYEAQSVMSLSVITAKINNPTIVIRNGPAVEALANREVIDAYRDRWSRVQ